MREDDTGTVTITVTGAGSTVTGEGQIVTRVGTGVDKGVDKGVTVSSERDVVCPSAMQIDDESMEGSEEHN